jgi:peptidyl-prolyl cis-trans isomerase C
MAKWNRLATAAVIVADVLLDRGQTRAAGVQSDEARCAEIVAHIGSARTILVGDLERRILAMPAFQRATFGDSPSAIRQRFLSDVMVRESLALQGAEAAGLDQKLPSAYAVDRARSNATIRAIRARLGPSASIPMDDVRTYYEANLPRYESAERYQIWRILCPTREEAQTVLEMVTKAPSPKTFSDVARDHSQDKATRLRGGNIGFVTEDGSSNEPGLRVDPAVVRAARTVRDGDVVPHPVPEGDSFAVVWRRGTLAASKRAIGDVAAQIRETVWSGRVKSETDRLVSRLRASNVRDLNAALLDDLDLEAPGKARARRAAAREAGVNGGSDRP